MSNNPNSGHGHVRPRPDGLVVRCGGPSLCTECRKEQQMMQQLEQVLSEDAKKRGIRLEDVE